MSPFRAGFNWSLNLAHLHPHYQIFLKLLQKIIPKTLNKVLNEITNDRSSTGGRYVPVLYAASCQTVEVFKSIAEKASSIIVGDSQYAQYRNALLHDMMFRLASGSNLHMYNSQVDEATHTAQVEEVRKWHEDTCSFIQHPKESMRKRAGAFVSFVENRLKTFYASEKQYSDRWIKLLETAAQACVPAQRDYKFRILILCINMQLLRAPEKNQDYLFLKNSLKIISDMKPVTDVEKLFLAKLNLCMGSFLVNFHSLKGMKSQLGQIEIENIYWLSLYRTGLEHLKTALDIGDNINTPAGIEMIRQASSEMEMAFARLEIDNGDDELSLDEKPFSEELYARKMSDIDQTITCFENLDKQFKKIEAIGKSNDFRKEFMLAKESLIQLKRESELIKLGSPKKLGKLVAMQEIILNELSKLTFAQDNPPYRAWLVETDAKIRSIKKYIASYQAPRPEEGKETKEQKAELMAMANEQKYPLPDVKQDDSKEEKPKPKEKGDAIANALITANTNIADIRDTLRSELKSENSSQNFSDFFVPKTDTYIRQLVTICINKIGGGSMDIFSQIREVESTLTKLNSTVRGQSAAYNKTAFDFFINKLKSIKQNLEMLERPAPSPRPANP
jgi:hypothetical protein